MAIKGEGGRVRFNARLVAFLLSSSVAYLVLRPWLEAGVDTGCAAEGIGIGVEGGWGGSISLTICAGSGSVGEGPWEETGVGVPDQERSRTGVAWGRVARPVRFIMKTDFELWGRASCGAVARPAAVLPETAANASGSAVELGTPTPGRAGRPCEGSKAGEVILPDAEVSAITAASHSSTLRAA